MICARCRNNVADGNSFCPTCGATVAPVNSYLPAEHWQTVFAEAKTDNKAIASLVFGCLFFLLPSALLAIILGHLSLAEIRKSAGRIKGRGLAVSGLVLGYFGLVAVTVFLVAVMVAAISDFRSKRSYHSARVQTITREPLAISSIRAINTSEIGFQIAHPAAGYTCKLDDLVGPAAMYGWRDPELAGGQKDGYLFVLRNCRGDNGHDAKTKYQITAEPINKQSGLRAFCSDESSNLRYDVRGSGKKCLENGPPL
jgi:hypothetical protein